MISPQDVKWLQVEATTKCNAWCPSCGRNKNGFELNPKLSIQDLDLDRFEQVVSQFPNLEVVHFCGTYGDAIAAKDIIAMVVLAKKYCKKIQLNTNGSLRTTQWWGEFALSLSDIEHDVWFCLDGLKGVHEVYRQGTDFDTIIKNAKAFIEAGGFATWQFIPWAHNEHQITECIRLSQQLGFKKFQFIKNARLPENPQHYQTGQSIEILPWSKNANFNKFTKKQQHVPADACMHLTQPSVYLNANGKLNVCCIMNVRNAVDDFNQLTDIDRNDNPVCLRSCGVPIA